MTQVDKNRIPDETAVLRDVLHTIAVTPNVSQCVSSILATALRLMDGKGAALLLFQDPALIEPHVLELTEIPPLDVLVQVATSSTTFTLNPALPDDVGAHYAASFIAPIRAQKAVVGALWMVFDTPRHAIDSQALAPILDGLTILVMTLRTQARHDNLVRNQSEFIRIVSHDLRSPLTSMLGFGSMLESGMVGDLNEKQQNFIEKIISGITQMTSLVENIQDAGRYDPDNGFYEMERAQCDIVAIVQKIAANHLVPADKQELTLATDIADDIPIIHADAHMLERAITNLIDNAIKYTPNRGEIIVQVRRQSDEIIIAVKDNGLGISPDNQKLLFERHRRIPREEHKRVKGSGLGLFIVRSVAQRHGGRAWVESAEGEGSSFSISLPIITSSALL